MRGEMRTTERVAAHIIEQRRLFLKERVFYVTHFHNPTKLAGVNNQSGCYTCTVCIYTTYNTNQSLRYSKLISKDETYTPCFAVWAIFLIKILIKSE